MDGLINPETAIIISIATIVFCLACLCVCLYVYMQPPKVVRLKIDPPDGALYTQLDFDGEDEITDNHKEKIKQAKQQVILWHVWNKNNGSCTVSEVWKLIQTEWNSGFEQYTEYSLWKVSKPLVIETLKSFAWDNNGGVITLEEKHYVIINVPVGNTTGRHMVALDECVADFESAKKQAMKKKIKKDRRVLKASQEVEKEAIFKGEPVPNLAHSLH